MRCKMRRKVTCWGGFFDSAIVGPNVSLASAAATTTLRRSKVAAATGCEQKVTTTAKTLFSPGALSLCSRARGSRKGGWPERNVFH